MMVGKVQTPSFQSADKTMKVILFSETSRYRIPRYQRPYSWTADHASDLIVESADVFQEVIRALDEINETNMKAIEEKVPKSVRRSLLTFAGVKGTPVYEGFVSGSMAYHRHLMRKPQSLELPFESCT